jgi:hypothetical protein
VPHRLEHLTRSFGLAEEVNVDGNMYVLMSDRSELWFYMVLNCTIDCAGVGCVGGCIWGWITESCAVGVRRFSISSSSSSKTGVG